MRFFILKPRHPVRLKKADLGKKTQWEPWLHAEKCLLPQLEVNVWWLVDMLLLRNKDQHLVNPLVRFATGLCNRAVEVESGCGGGVAGLWSPTPPRAVESEPKTFRWWNRSLKFGFRFHRDSLWGKRVIHILWCFLWYFEPNCSGTRAKSFQMLEPEPKNCNAQSWSRSLKFEYRLHTLARQAKQRTRTNCNLIIAWHQNSKAGSCAVVSYGQINCHCNN